MLPILAWRNIWRNPTRSLVVILAIGIGIWAALFMTGFATGMGRSYVNNAIADVVSHLQVHHPGFREQQEVSYRLDRPEVLERTASALPEVKAVSLRTLTNAMLASGQGVRGVQVKGVEPEAEAAISGLNDNVREGGYFDGRKNQILLGTKLAEKLETGPGKKLVLTFQDVEGTITAGAFRVAGVFESGNSGFDEQFVFVRRSDLNRLLLPDLTNDSLANELAILLKEPEHLLQVKSALEAAFPALLIETYKEVAPDLQLYEEQLSNVSLIYLVVILLALVFGIINTMLMAVLERERELGMLMAIGMNKGEVFGMIVLETLLLCLVGAPLGLLLGWDTNWWFGTRGLNLSAFSDSLRMYGMSDQIYFDLQSAVYWQACFLLVVTALLAAIYPAWKAIRLRPVETIR